MFLLSVFSPLLGGLINTAPLVRFLGHRGSTVIAIICMLIAFLSSAVVYYEVAFMGCPVSFDLAGTWFSVGSFSANWSFNFDTLTANMLFTVTSVSLAVHLYACDYMRQDPHLNLFLGYLSFFTGFMCVLVAADNLLVMLVGWEGKLYCPNGFVVERNSLNTFFNSNNSWEVCPINNCDVIRSFYLSRIPAVNRHGLHSPLFKQTMLGFLLGDGWLEKHGQGVRMCISLIDRFADVAQWYLVLLYGMGYTDRLQLGNPLMRKNRNVKQYYQLKTFTFASLLKDYHMWYSINPVTNALQKSLPNYVTLKKLLTPFALCIWIMGDGSGMQDGGFKICSHSFTKEQNQLLCDILMEKYGIYANVLTEKKKFYYIRVWKRSTRMLYCIVKPFLLPSCEYKFRHVKQRKKALLIITLFTAQLQHQVSFKKI